MGQLERDFQAKLISSLETRFPGCIVLKNDPNYIQGFPDLSVFYKKHWAALECKKSENAPVRPNQSYYVKKLDSMSFSRFICPENKEDVLHEMELAWGSGE